MVGYRKKRGGGRREERREKKKGSRGGGKGEGRRGDAHARTQSPEKHGDRAKSKRGGRERGDVPRRCS